MAVIPRVCRNGPGRGRARVDGCRAGAGRTRGVRSSRSAHRITSSSTLVSSAGKAAPSSCPAPASPARRRSCRRGSRQVRRTTPMSSRCSTATGRVHPFARPLAIRDGSTASTRRVPVAALGAETGTTPLPIGLVLVTSYRAGARWRPRRLTAAPTLLALMRHTVAARGNPAHSMPILKQAVSGGMAFAGLRGEARAAGFRGSQARPNANAVRRCHDRGAI